MILNLRSEVVAGRERRRRVRHARRYCRRVRVDGGRRRRVLADECRRRRRTKGGARPSAAVYIREVGGPRRVDGARIAAPLLVHLLHVDAGRAIEKRLGDVRRVVVGDRRRLHALLVGTRAARERRSPT